MTNDLVNVDNFVRAETDRMFGALLAQAGGLNRWQHSRTPTPLDQQLVIRMNRDTLYSVAVVDIREGAALSLPEAGDRYLSAMVVNRDHHINRVFHDAGTHEITMAEFDSDFVVVAIRIFVDPADPDDVAAVNTLQDQVVISAASEGPFTPPEYNPASLDATRAALLQLAAGMSGFDRAFGARGDVDPVRHLIGTAAGWGGLPEQEARYVNVSPGLPVGEYRMTFGDVPVDGFWSVSVYNAEGYFDNRGGQVSVNNVTAERDADGGVTIHFGGSGDGRTNCLSISEGWNFLVPLYRPREDAVDGRWQVPAVTAVH